MFGINSTIITGGLILVLFLAVAYKYNDMKSQIHTLEQQLELATHKNNELILELGISNSNNNKLSTELDKANESIKKITIDKDKVTQAFDTYKNLPLEQKIQTNEFKQLLNMDKEYKQTCDYGLELNKMISGLKYEDL